MAEATINGVPFTEQQKQDFADSLGLVRGIQNPVTGVLRNLIDGKAYLPTITPYDNSYAAMITAIANCAAAGGGVVKLAPGGIGVPQSVIVPEKVKIIGSGVGSDRFQNGGVAQDGTYLYPTGTGYPCFVANHIDLPTWTKNFVSSIAIQDLTITGGFSCGIQIGAINSAGPYKSNFENLAIEGCTEWGIRIANSELCSFRNIYIKNSRDGVLFEGTTAEWNGGDSILDFVNVDRDFSKSYTPRGIVFAVRNGATQVNGVRARGVGANGPYSYSTTNGVGFWTESVTISSGNSSIPVSAVERYAIGSPVIFDGSAPSGFSKNCLYFVKTKTGTAGTGSITLSAKPVCDVVAGTNSDTAITPSSSGAFNLYTKGFPAIEFQHGFRCLVDAGYCESGGTASVSVTDSSGVEIRGGFYNGRDTPGTFAAAAESYALAIRDSAETVFHSAAGGTIVDSDSAWFGNGWTNNATQYKTGKSGFNGVGLRVDGQNASTGGLWLRNGPKADLSCSKVGDRSLVMFNANIRSENNCAFSGSFSMNGTAGPHQANAMQYQPAGASGATLTLPVLGNTSAAQVVSTFTNLSANAVSIALTNSGGGTPYFVRSGTKISYPSTISVAAYSSVTLTGLWDGFQDAWGVTQ